MKMRRQVLAAAIALLAVAAFTGAGSAAQPQARSGHGRGRARPASINTIDTGRRIDVNNINMFVTNIGAFANDAGNVTGGGGEGLYFPKGTTKNAMYAAGPYFGCIIDSTLHVTVTEYAPEWAPGNILPGSATAGTPAGTSADHSNPDFVVYKMVVWTGDPADSTHLELTAAQIAADPTADPLVHHSWNEYMRGAVPYGAPWKTYRLPDPSVPGDSLDIPGPDVTGDMMLWAVYNDADPSTHTNAPGNSAPIGLEIQQSTFAFNRQGAIGNTVFIKYRIINKGIQTVTNAYFSQWSDPDPVSYTHLTLPTILRV